MSSSQSGGAWVIPTLADQKEHTKAEATQETVTGIFATDADYVPIEIVVYKTWHGRRFIDDRELSQMERRWPPEDNWVSELQG